MNTNLNWVFKISALSRLSENSRPPLLRSETPTESCLCDLIQIAMPRVETRGSQNKIKINLSKVIKARNVLGRPLCWDHCAGDRLFYRWRHNRSTFLTIRSSDGIKCRIMIGVLNTRGQKYWVGIVQWAPETFVSEKIADIFRNYDKDNDLCMITVASWVFVGHRFSWAAFLALFLAHEAKSRSWRMFINISHVFPVDWLKC